MGSFSKVWCYDTLAIYQQPFLKPSNILPVAVVIGEMVSTIGWGAGAMVADTGKKVQTTAPSKDWTP